MLCQKDEIEEKLRDSSVSEEVSSQVNSEAGTGTVEQKDTEKKVQKVKKYKKVCWLCRQGKLMIDYKEVEFLQNYLKRYNKILIHKFSGNCLKHQHQLSQAIKRARYIALLPFVAE